MYSFPTVKLFQKFIHINIQTSLMDNHCRIFSVERTLSTPLWALTLKTYSSQRVIYFRNQIFRFFFLSLDGNNIQIRVTELIFFSVHLGRI